MNRNERSISRGRLWICLMAALIGLAVLLVVGPGMTAMAGPTQEQGQEEAQEKKDQPKKYTNSDLKKAPRSSDSDGEAATTGGDEVPARAGDGLAPGDEVTAEDAVPDPWASVGVATDSEGRGEEYWRRTMTDARNAVTTAKEELDQLQSEMNRCQVDFTAIDDPAARAVVDTRIQELFGLIEAAKNALADKEQAVQDLQEEARRSGALPGWLR